jgi:hypothetical protein
MNKLTRGLVTAAVVIASLALNACDSSLIGRATPTATPPHITASDVEAAMGGVKSYYIHFLQSMMNNYDVYDGLFDVANARAAFTYTGWMNTSINYKEIIIGDNQYINQNGHWREQDGGTQVTSLITGTIYSMIADFGEASITGTESFNGVNCYVYSYVGGIPNVSLSQASYWLGVSDLIPRRMTAYRSSEAPIDLRLEISISHINEPVNIQPPALK